MSEKAASHNLSVYPSEVAGLKMLQRLFGLHNTTDVVRRLVWRHRHIPPEIKQRFQRARRAPMR